MKVGNRSQSDYRQDAYFISLIALFIIIPIAYIHYKYIDIFLMGACIGISVAFGKLVQHLLLPNYDIISENLNGKIGRKYFYLVLSLSFLIIFLIYVYTPKIYNLDGSDPNILEWKVSGEPVHEMDLNKTKSEKLKAIFPELGQIPFCGFLKYETNGHLAIDFPDSYDNIKNSIELGFQNYDANCDSNSGLMIGPLDGYDVTKFESGGLTFIVEGKSGGERFGVGFKDIFGNEFKVNATNYFTDKSRITTKEWRRVFIPLSIFKHVILSHLDVFSLYSNGQMHSGEDYQTIYVAQFEFTKNANIVKTISTEL